jgi:hypothetical protein
MSWRESYACATALLVTLWVCSLKSRSPVDAREFPDRSEKIPCSVWRNESLTAMRATAGPPRIAKFPVLFPDSKEFRRRRVRS